MGLNIRKISTGKWHLSPRVFKDGRDLRKRETFFGTRSEAEERALELKRILKEGASFRATVRKVETFGDVLELYRNRRLSLTGIDESRYKTLSHDLGKVPLNRLSERMEEYVRHLRTMASGKTGKVLSNASVNRLMAMAKTSLNLAVDLELLDKNPLGKARFPKLREVPRDRDLTADERQRLLNTIAKEAPHLLAITQYALQIPCRKSELINMRREDLNQIHPTIRVRNGTTKTDQGCDKPIPPDMMAYFRNIPAASEYLFFREEKGRYYPLGCFNKAWCRCLRLAGIRNFHFHDTRHIAATELLNNGTPEQVVQSVAGWKSGNMIRTYYHRDVRNTLSLIRFNSGTGQIPDTYDVRERKIC